MRQWWTIRHSLAVWLLWCGIWQAVWALTPTVTALPEPEPSILPAGLHPTQQRRALVQQLEQLAQAGDVAALVALVQPAQGLLSYPDRLFDDTLRLLLRVQQPAVALSLWQTRQHDLPDYQPARYDLYWQLLVANGEFSQAQFFAESVAQREPRQVQWQQRLLEHAYRAKQPALASIALQRLVQYRGDAGDWLAWLTHPAVQQSPQFLTTLIQLDARSPLPPSLLAQALAHFKQQPQTAIAWLQQRLQRTPEAATAQLLAKWASRYHDPQTALAAWEQFARLAPDARQSILPRVALLRAQGQRAAALSLLEGALVQAAPEETAFWQALGDVAWEQGQRPLARRAYRQLASNAQPDAESWQRLSELLSEDDPIDAAQAATEVWLQTRQSHDFFRAVARFEQAQWQGDSQRLWSSLTPDDVQRLSHWPAFFSARAQYWQRQGQTVQAVADWKIALARQPRDETVLLGWLWALLEQGQSRELSAALKKQQHLANRVPALFAAAALQMQQARRALPYLRQQLTQQSDPLWQLAYAEALEMSGASTQAWAVRQSVWQQTRGEDHPQWRRRTQQALHKGGRFAEFMATLPPAAARWQNELLRQWLNSTESQEVVKRWLVRRYANTLMRPAWQPLAQALAENNTRGWEKAVLSLSAGSRTSNQNQPLNLTKDAQQEIAPFPSTSLPQTNTLELTWSPRAQRILGDVITTQQGEWHSRQHRLTVNLPLSTTQQLQWQYQQRQDQHNNQLQRRHKNQLSWQQRTPEQQLTIGWEYDLEWQRHGVRVAGAWQRGAWRGALEMAHHVSASDSESLAALAQQTHWRGDVWWALSARDHLQLQVQRTHWQWQDGTPLAQQTRWGMQAQHQWHFADPSVRLFAGWMQRQLDINTNVVATPGGGSVYLPSQGRQIHVGLAWNDPMLLASQAQWQSQGRVQLNHSPRLGYGGEAQFGLQRRLRSGEQLGVLAFWRQGVDGLVPITRGLAVQYRYD